MTETALSAHMETLSEHRDRLELVDTVSLFDADPSRFQTMSVALDGLLFDFSKNRIDADALSVLFSVAKAADLEKCRDRMFSGSAINTSEGRAVLHTALRSPAGSMVEVDGVNIIPEIQEVLSRMGTFSDAVRDGSYQVSGGKITDIVNIGIGGSDLGPAMAARALKPYHDGPRVHFVSNVDGADIADTLADLSPETTLFIIASKTFTTIETMTNARTAQGWVKGAVGEGYGKHFAALSTNLDATREFGIDDERTFGFWEWVGGRYSLWSAIGLSLMLAIGKDRFHQFLAGAHAIDRHFVEVPLEQNIPVLMALLGIWHRNVSGFATHAVLPYDNRLSRFPAYLQQLDMESNGKAVRKNGEPVLFDTGPIVWGEPGTNGQHAFYQLIHQGTDVIPCDFLLAANPQEPASLSHHHRLLVANCLAQAEALMVGKSEMAVRKELAGKGVSDEEIDTLAPQKTFSGNRPSNLILYERLDPETLGKLIALYEHKVFVQGVIWGINSFDQWGVELGKVLATDLEKTLSEGKDPKDKDGSTRGLIEAYRHMSS